MKKNLGRILVVAFGLTILTGCIGGLKVENNTVYVQKNGKITGASVESFDKDYYNAEELEAFVEERVSDYTTEYGEKTVKINKFSVEEGIARLNIKYAGYEDYARFNGVEIFAGTIPQAMAAGYDFKDTFLEVEDGVLAGEVDAEEVLEDSDCRVVILNEKVNVKVDGEIQYTSADYTSLAAEDTVAIVLPEDAMDGEELALTYIIYK